MKKLISIVLVLMILASCVCISATATSNSNVLYFDANLSEWGDFSKVYCHIWSYGEEPFFAWQSKKELCTDEDGDGVWTYDLDSKGVVLEDGVQYCVIFSNERGVQTYNLLFDTTVLGATAYSVESDLEAPTDSTKKAQVVFWKDLDKTVYGPEKCITSIGNVVGTCLPKGVTSEMLFEDFLLNTYDNAMTYSGKTSQQLIDDTASALGLTKNDVESCILNVGADFEWNKTDSTLECSEASADEVEVNTAVRQYKELSGDKEFTTRRYYFLRPDGTNGMTAKSDYIYEKGSYVPSWDDEYSYSGATHISWEKTDRLDHENYLGYVAMNGDSDGVYYADVPDFVDCISWNNGVDYKNSDDEDMWLYARNTFNIGCEYYDPGESENYPNGVDSFDNMIFVINPDEIPWGNIGDPGDEPGEWYYYYGNGCYGFEADGNSYDCIRDDHKHETPEGVHIVAGDDVVCGSWWDPTDMNNQLIFNEESGLFEKTYENVPKGTYQFVITTDFEFPGSESEGVTSERFLVIEVLENGTKLTITFDGVDMVSYKLLPPPMVSGDINGDGNFSILDATEIQLVLAKFDEFKSESAEAMADLNKDGEVTILDATKIQLVLAKIEYA